MTKNIVACPDGSMCATLACPHRGMHERLATCESDTCPKCAPVTEAVKELSVCPKALAKECLVTRCTHYEAHAPKDSCLSDNAACPSCVTASPVPEKSTEEVAVKKCKLKVHLVLFDRAIAMQVLYQDPRFDGAEFTAKNGVIVISATAPEIVAPRLVYLRGSEKKKDTRVVAAYFENNKERNDFMRRLKAALRDWAKNAPEFIETSADSSIPEEDISADEVFEI